jgi:hypothetical protein
MVWIFRFRQLASYWDRWMSEATLAASGWLPVPDYLSSMVQRLHFNGALSSNEAITSLSSWNRTPEPLESIASRARTSGIVSQPPPAAGRLSLDLRGLQGSSDVWQVVRSGKLKYSFPLTRSLPSDLSQNRIISQPKNESFWVVCLK